MHGLRTADGEYIGLGAIVRACGGRLKLGDRKTCAKAGPAVSGSAPTMTATERRAVANGWGLGAFRWAVSELKRERERRAAQQVPEPPDLAARIRAARGTQPRRAAFPMPEPPTEVAAPRVAQPVEHIPPPPDLAVRLRQARARRGAR